MFLIRIILFFLILYVLLYLAGKLFALWFRNKSRKYQGNTRSDYRKEGEVTIENSKSTKGKKFSKGEGEYISFEEMEDK
jgi:hypothetical protein